MLARLPLLLLLVALPVRADAPPNPAALDPFVQLATDRAAGG